MGERARRAEDYFRQVAGRWDELRALYVHDDEVERQLAALIAEEQVAALLDIGTGTGRILEILADKVAHAVGIDLSPDMLMLARSKLERARLRNCVVRKRSEEHTSELQSLMPHLVCRLLLEKKKNHTRQSVYIRIA